MIRSKVEALKRFNQIVPPSEIEEALIIPFDRGRFEIKDASTPLDMTRRT